MNEHLKRNYCLWPLFDVKVGFLHPKLSEFFFGFAIEEISVDSADEKTTKKVRRFSDFLLLFKFFSKADWNWKRPEVAKKCYHTYRWKKDKKVLSVLFFYIVPFTIAKKCLLRLDARHLSKTVKSVLGVSIENWMNWKCFLRF